MEMEATKNDTSCDEMERMGEAMKKIAAALRKLPDDATRLRVVKAAAALYGVDTREPG